MSGESETIEISDPGKLPAQPLVSVYMLTYNHRKFIADAIEGVIIQQCNFPIELIIGEDCSADGTKEIVLDYQKRYPKLIRVLTAERNVGAHANAARCLAATKGKFIAICEGDDYWHHPRKLQMQVDLMSANPDMTFCHTDFDRKTRFRTWRSKHKSHPSPWLARGNAYKALLYELSVITATSMFRRDTMLAFTDTHFYNIKWPFGDYNRQLFASQKGVVGYLGVSTAVFRKTSGSACNNSNTTHLRMKVSAWECAESFMSSYPVNIEDQRQIRARLKRKIYHAAFYAGRIDVMQSCHEWLVSDGFKSTSLRYHMQTLVIKLGLPFQVLRAIKNFVDLHLSSIPS